MATPGPDKSIPGNAKAMQGQPTATNSPSTLDTPKDSVPLPVTDSQSGSLVNTSEKPEPQSNPGTKPIVIGIYGIPGCGKTTLLNRLRSSLDPKKFSFYEGSEVISKLVPNGGLEAFKKMTEIKKNFWREKAIKSIGSACIESKTVGIVTEHIMFWVTEGTPAPTSALTPIDWYTYTHIIYLNIDPEVVAQRTMNDKTRTRTNYSVSHLKAWQHEEKSQLRALCLENLVLFTVRSESTSVLPLIKDFSVQNETWNTNRVAEKLSMIFGSDLDSLEKVLVMDADRTLCAEDTGKMFWKKLNDVQFTGDPLKQLFESSFGYSYQAFCQATLLYEDVNKDQFHAVCSKVAKQVKLYPAFKTLLQKIREHEHEHVGAVIITCGLYVIWEEILRREGLSDVVKVIGNGFTSDRFVVTPLVKASFVAQLQDKHNKYVIAFGDSPVDLKMMMRAYHAIVVVGDESTRSKTMDMELSSAIDDELLYDARQILLPETSTHRLDTDRLPLTTFTDDEFLEDVFDYVGVELIDAGDKEAAQLLMTPTRNAKKSGPILREAHRRVGFYLATEYLSKVIGLEEYSIKHVQGGLTIGHRLKDESKTTIVALMRGGEPLAFGVNEAFPDAMFVHANNPADLKLQHLQGKSTVILVDSVINNGTTIVEFVEHILQIHGPIKIVVVTGVIQRESVSKGGKIFNLAIGKDLTFVTLRVSDNKFTGQGPTDTGNRLFNTTSLP